MIFESGHFEVCGLIFAAWFAVELIDMLEGTVKSNLFLGLPVTNPYRDEELLKIREDVGLLPILTLHHGLNTKIGEGGLNLSGGQRQRLNFAALFLRALIINPISSSSMNQQVI